MVEDYSSDYDKGFDDGKRYEQGRGAKSTVRGAPNETPFPPASSPLQVCKNCDKFIIFREVELGTWRWVHLQSDEEYCITITAEPKEMQK